MVGFRRAGLVVAINPDPTAPVFDAADYGIVGRLARRRPRARARRARPARADGRVTPTGGLAVGCARPGWGTGRQSRGNGRAPHRGNPPYAAGRARDRGARRRRAAGHRVQEQLELVVERRRPSRQSATAPTSPWPTPARRSRAARSRSALNAETDGWSPIKNQWAGSAYIVGRRDLRPHRRVRRQRRGPALPGRVAHAQRRLHPVDDQDAARRDVPRRRRRATRAALKTDFDAQRRLAPDRRRCSPRSTSIEVTDPLTVTFTMSQPWSTFPDTMATQVGAIAAPAMVNAPDGGVREPDRHRPVLVRELGAGQQARGQEEPELLARRATRCSTASTSRCVPDLSSRERGAETRRRST